MMDKEKLIEAVLPLDAVNQTSARKKSIRYGHPSTLHLWWPRRPLVAARAVIFARMVDDSSAHADLRLTKEAQEKERRRLFRLIEDLVLWENTTIAWLWARTVKSPNSALADVDVPLASGFMLSTD